MIPTAYLDALGGAIRKLLATERLILDPARAPDVDLALFEATRT